jgi:biopolymer transport protein ExbD
VRRRERARPDINVTPLVDVVLVLLIIFMVVVPQMEAGAAVTLPGITHPDPRTDAASAPITVTVTAGGALFLEKAPMERGALIATLSEMHLANRSRRVILKGDRDARYRDVRSLFRDCQQIGFPGVSLQVGDRRAGAARRGGQAD